MRKRLGIVIILIAVFVGAVFFIDWHVSHTVEQQMYNNIHKIGVNKVGLLLGTAKYNRSGSVNLYYKYRIDAAVQLYNAGKIDCIIVSGDNSRKEYNEPETMQNDLIAAGIPADRIYPDYAGFRTLDSIVRCMAIFSVKEMTIISQKFHNERALFIANQKGFNAVAYNAQDPPKNITVKVMIREKLARVKMVIDLLFNKQPKFYGDKIDVK